jgi:hypothetical protein
MRERQRHALLAAIMSPLLELAGTASLAWDPKPSGVFAATEAAAAAERTARLVADFVMQQYPLQHEAALTMNQQASRIRRLEDELGKVRAVLREGEQQHHTYRRKMREVLRIVGEPCDALDVARDIRVFKDDAVAILMQHVGVGPDGRGESALEVLCRLVNEREALLAAHGRGALDAGSQDPRAQPPVQVPKHNHGLLAECGHNCPARGQ